MKKTTTKRPSRTFTDPTTWNEIEEGVSEIQDNLMITHQTILDENVFGKFSLPTSCCKSKCKSYYSRGCFSLLYNDITRVVFMVKSVAMISSIFQVRGEPLLNLDLHFGNCLIVNNFRSFIC